MANLKYYKVACLLLTMAGVIVPTTKTLARFQPPPGMERPAGRQGAATRNPCNTNNQDLGTVLPRSNYGETTRGYPTFYWYHANHGYNWAEFELYETQNQLLADYPIYRTTFRMNRAESLSHLTLPRGVGLAPLEVGKEYVWKVNFICAPEGSSPDDVFADGSQLGVQGWVKRVSSMASSFPLDPTQYNQYAEAGLWYDAVHALALARRQQPQNFQLNGDWRALMAETAIAPEKLD